MSSRGRVMLDAGAFRGGASSSEVIGVPSLRHTMWGDSTRESRSLAVGRKEAIYSSVSSVMPPPSSGHGAATDRGRGIDRGALPAGPAAARTVECKNRSARGKVATCVAQLRGEVRGRYRAHSTAAQQPMAGGVTTQQQRPRPRSAASMRGRRPLSALAANVPAARPASGKQPSRRKQSGAAARAPSDAEVRAALRSAQQRKRTAWKAPEPAADDQLSGRGDARPRFNGDLLPSQMKPPSQLELRASAAAAAAPPLDPPCTYLDRRGGRYR